MDASSLQDAFFQDAPLPLSLLEDAALWYYRQLGGGDKILVGTSKTSLHSKIEQGDQEDSDGGVL
jgi:hypothetical protein